MVFRSTQASTFGMLQSWVLGFCRGARTKRMFDIMQIDSHLLVCCYDMRNKKLKPHETPRREI